MATAVLVEKGQKLIDEQGLRLEAPDQSRRKVVGLDNADRQNEPPARVGWCAVACRPCEPVSRREIARQMMSSGRATVR